MSGRVFVTRIIPASGLDLIKAECQAEIWPAETPPDPDVLLAKVPDVDGLLCLLTDPIDASLIKSAPRLRVVSNYAVGFDNIDVAAATARKIPVGNTPGVLTETTADLAFSLLMAAARRIVEGAQYVRAGRWLSWGPTLLLGHDVHDATLGVLGMGRIGQAITKRALGFGMRVLFHDPTVGEVPDLPQATACSLGELLSQADFISLHVPLTEATHHLINSTTLGQMKRTAILINTARGPVIDHDALFEALAQGQIAGAALDVTEPEPLSPDHRLLTLPNCLVIPHLGSGSVATRAKMAEMAARNLLAGLRGEKLPYCVNPQVYEI